MEEKKQENELEKKLEKATEQIPVEKEKESSREEVLEKEFLAEKERIIKEGLEREIAMMKEKPELKKEVEDEAKRIKELEMEGKLKSLFDLAKTKGVSFAIGVAKKLDDPSLLDIFHDLLSKDDYYKKFNP